MKSKKAMVEIQFNWIFVLIAGAIILTFFVGLIVKGNGTSKTQINLVVSRGLEAQITGTKVSTGSATPIDISVGDATFDCGSYNIRGTSTKLNQMTVFTPGLLKGKRIMAWAYPWDVPFRATNFLFLTSPQVRYIFVTGGDADAEDIFDEFPEELKGELDPDFNTLTDKNNYKVRIVYFEVNVDNSHPIKFTNTDSKDITAIRIEKDLVDGYKSQKVEFYTANPSKNTWIPNLNPPTVDYYSKPSIFAAIFSENKEYYECVMKKEFKKLNRVAEVLKDRSDRLVAEDYASGMPSENIDCENYHTAASITLNTIVGAGLLQIHNIDGWATTLEDQNEYAESKSCALIY